MRRRRRKSVRIKRKGSVLLIHTHTLGAEIQMTQLNSQPLIISPRSPDLVPTLFTEQRQRFTLSGSLDVKFEGVSLKIYTLEHLHTSISLSHWQM